MLPADRHPSLPRQRSGFRHVPPGSSL